MNLYYFVKLERVILKLTLALFASNQNDPNYTRINNRILLSRKLNTLHNFLENKTLPKTNIWCSLCPKFPDCLTCSCNEPLLMMMKKSCEEFLCRININIKCKSQN